MSHRGWHACFFLLPVIFPQTLSNFFCLSRIPTILCTCSSVVMLSAVNLVSRASLDCTLSSCFLFVVGLRGYVCKINRNADRSTVASMRRETERKRGKCCVVCMLWDCPQYRGGFPLRHILFEMQRWPRAGLLLTDDVREMNLKNKIAQGLQHADYIKKYAKYTTRVSCKTKFYFFF